MSDRGRRGVGLAVVAVLLVAVGALAVLAAALQPMRIERAGRLRVGDSLAALEAALVDFAIVHKRLPCPAGPSAATGAEGGAPGACGDQPDGMVPWRGLGVAARLARDPWGRAISYRVAEALTAERALLAVSAPDTGLGPAVQDDPAAGSGAAAVLISHGGGGDIVRALALDALLARARLGRRR